MNRYFDYSSEVQQALEQNRPLLALESTLISHGLPYPDNLKIAHAVEEIARDQGTTPATIAILNGRIKIGLTADELHYLATSNSINKVSVRDIPYIISQSLHGATTVAATICLAAKAGINLMATGGVGGVHRGNELDISADLIELARTKIAVVCAGAKSILDIPKTLEFLETHSVPVIGYKTPVFPAFYTATSPHKIAQIETIDALTRFLQVHWDLALPAGVLIANPIPELNEIPADSIEPAITAALKQAEREQISGKAITPFLLKELGQMTSGRSLQANLALIKNNVRLGAELANQLHLSSTLSRGMTDSMSIQR